VIFLVTRFFGVHKITFYDVALKRLHKQRIVPLKSTAMWGLAQMHDQ